MFVALIPSVTLAIPTLMAPKSPSVTLAASRPAMVMDASTLTVSTPVGTTVGTAVGETVGTGLGACEGTAVGGDVDGNSVGPAVRVVGTALGTAVGACVGHTVPIDVPVVTAHPLVTLLERACTSVGTSEQNWFDASWKYDVILVRLPSWVGMVELNEF